MELAARYPITIVMRSDLAQTDVLAAKIGIEMKKAGVPASEIEVFYAEVSDNRGREDALRRMLRWVNVVTEA